MSVTDRDAILADIDTMVGYAQEGLAIMRGWMENHAEEMATFASFPSGYLGMVAEDNAVSLYEGELRMVDAARKPIEVADKRRLGELEAVLSGNAKVMAMSKAQADFSELMSRVNRAIYEKIAAEDADEEEAPPAK